MAVIGTAYRINLLEVAQGITGNTTRSIVVARRMGIEIRLRDSAALLGIQWPIVRIRPETECSRAQEVAAQAAAGRQEPAIGCPLVAEMVFPAEVAIASAISECPPAQVAPEAVRLAVLRPDRIEVPRKLAATGVHPVWEVAVEVVVAAAAVVEGAGDRNDQGKTDEIKEIQFAYTECWRWRVDAYNLLPDRSLLRSTANEPESS